MSIQEKLRLISNHEWLQNTLDANGITIAQISRSTGLDYDSVYQYTSGKKKMPKTMQSILFLFFEHVMSVEVK